MKLFLKGYKQMTINTLNVDNKKNVFLETFQFKINTAKAV